jgi:hypothetical protein
VRLPDGKKAHYHGLHFVHMLASFTTAAGSLESDFF